MRAEQKELGKDKKGEPILENDRCEYMEVIKDKEYKCLRRTSWKCDNCSRWMCHEHFKTFENKIELCLNCISKISR
jgi:hypothetical protein